MRDDDEQLRHYVPLLRRIIILVAVLTAVPVMLWTITAFVRSFVGPPQLPTFRPLAATALIQTPDNSASNQDTDDQEASAPQPPSDPLPAIVQARASMTDAPDQTASSDSKAPATALALANAPPAVPSFDARAGANFTPPAMPDGAAPSTGSLAAQPSVWADPPADQALAAAPLTSPIPLPRRRPHVVALAQIGMPQPGSAQASPPPPLPMAVPVPRPRPDAAGPAAPPPPTAETTAGPLDWLQNVLPH